MLVLSQTGADGQEYVISYASRLLTKADRNCCVTRKELLALLAVVTFLNHFLIGTKFVIRWFKSPEGQLARWQEKLQEFDFSIVHRPWRKHSNANALSQLPCRQCSRPSDSTIAIISSAEICGGALTSRVA